MGRILATGMALAIGLLQSAVPARADASDDIEACSISASKAKWNEVQFYCTRAIDSGQLSSPLVSLAFALRCRADNGLQQPALAIEHCSRAIEILPGDKSAYLNLGFAYLAREEPALAIAAFDSLLARYPESLEGYYHRGLAYRAKGEHARAIEDFNRALAIDPNDAGAYHTRGNIRFALGDYALAIQDYDQSLLINPQPIDRYQSRGHAHFIIGNFSAASGDFAVLVEREPTNGYFVLLRSIAGARAGENVARTFETDAARVDLTTWPGPIVKYFLGNLSKESLRQMAEADEQPGSRSDRICEYDLYVGQGAMLFNDLATAQAMFQQVALDCPAGSIADRLAEAELARMPQ